MFDPWRMNENEAYTFFVLAHYKGRKISVTVVCCNVCCSVCLVCAAVCVAVCCSDSRYIDDNLPVARCSVSYSGRCGCVMQCVLQCGSRRLLQRVLQCALQ